MNRGLCEMHSYSDRLTAACSTAWGTIPGHVTAKVQVAFHAIKCDSWKRIIQGCLLSLNLFQAYFFVVISRFRSLFVALSERRGTECELAEAKSESTLGTHSGPPTQNEFGVTCFARTRLKLLFCHIFGGLQVKVSSSLSTCLQKMRNELGETLRTRARIVDDAPLQNTFAWNRLWRLRRKHEVYRFCLSYVEYS